MVELDMINIATKVLLLSSFLAIPHQGHLLNALHVMAHLKTKHNTRLVLDPTYPDINEDDFRAKEDWKP